MNTVTFDGTNSYKFAKVLTSPTVAFKAENAEGSASDPTFGNVEFTPFTAFSLVKMSNEVRDDSVNIVEAVRDTLAREFAVFLENKIAFGSGSGEPEGINNYSNAVSVSMGTNGAVFTNYDRIVELIRDVKNNKFNPTALIGAPRSHASLAVLKDSNNQYLMPPKYLDNYPMLETTAIPTDQTQGTNNDASSIFTGDFRQLYLGIRSQLQITPLNERYAEFNQTALLATMRFDSQPFYEEAFGKLIGIR